MQIKILLEPEDHRRISDAAHAARLPTAVFTRELVLGRIPKLARPLASGASGLTFQSKEILNIARASISNLRQLDSLAQHCGHPLSKLAGQDGPLSKLSEKFRLLGLQIKESGDLPYGQADAFLTKIVGPADALNDLARSLNAGDQAGREVWFHVLTDLQTDLQTAVEQPAAVTDK